MLTSNSAPIASFTGRVQIAGNTDVTSCGISLDTGNVLRLTGAPDDAFIDVWGDAGAARFEVHHPAFAGPAQYSLVFMDGKPAMVIEHVQLHVTGTGLGTSMFVQQAEGCVALGLVSICLIAASGFDGGAARYNGNYTWARLGFDAPFEPDRVDLENHAPVTVHQGFASVLEMMADPACRRWWRTCQTSPTMRFDLAYGSRSWQVLLAYLREKKIHAGLAGLR